MKKTKKLTAVLLSLSMIVSSVAITNPTSASAAKKVALSTKSLTVTVGQSKKLKLKNNKKKTTWAVTSGKKNISLKGKKKTEVIVTGVKKGTAKVQATAGKKKYSCKVTVKAKAEPTVQPSKKPSSDNDGIMTLYYNDKNAKEVVKQIKASTSLVHVIVEKGVISIGDDAFNQCSNLTSITIPDSVTSIGEQAFSKCKSLQNISFGRKVTTLGAKVLYQDRSVKRVTFRGKLLKKIGKKTFREVPKSVRFTVPKTKAKKYKKLIVQSK